MDGFFPCNFTIEFLIQKLLIKFMFTYTYGARLYCNVGQFQEIKAKGSLVNINVWVEFKIDVSKKVKCVVIQASSKTFFPTTEMRAACSTLLETKRNCIVVESQKTESSFRTGCGTGGSELSQNASVSPVNRI
jgi:hypothetical protein